MTDITQADLRLYSATVRRALRGWLAYHRLIVAHQDPTPPQGLDEIRERTNAATDVRFQHDACSPEYWAGLERIVGGGK
jgi:hypothetical protein